MFYMFFLILVQMCFCFKVAVGILNVFCFCCSNMFLLITLFDCFVCFFFVQMIFC